MAISINASLQLLHCDKPTGKQLVPKRQNPHGLATIGWENFARRCVAVRALWERAETGAAGVTGSSFCCHGIVTRFTLCADGLTVNPFDNRED